MAIPSTFASASGVWCVVMETEKPRRVDSRATWATPFNDRQLAVDMEELRKTFDGELWVGYTRSGIEAYRGIRELKHIPGRTYSRRAEEWDEAVTKDGKWFYFKEPIPPDVRNRIKRVRVGGSGTKDMILFAAKDRKGGTAAWLFHPKQAEPSPSE